MTRLGLGRTQASHLCIITKREVAVVIDLRKVQRDQCSEPSPATNSCMEE
jgi:hypothetical protein